MIQQCLDTAKSHQESSLEFHQRTIQLLAETEAQKRSRDLEILQLKKKSVEYENIIKQLQNIISREGIKSRNFSRLNALQAPKTPSTCKKLTT